MTRKVARSGAWQAGAGELAARRWRGRMRSGEQARVAGELLAEWGRGGGSAHSDSIQWSASVARQGACPTGRGANARILCMSRRGWDESGRARRLRQQRFWK